MQPYHRTDVTQFGEFSKLQNFVEESRGKLGTFEEFELNLAKQMRALENKIKAEQLGSYYSCPQSFSASLRKSSMCIGVTCRDNRRDMHAGDGEDGYLLDGAYDIDGNIEIPT
jgi:hypothetical protein